MTEHDTPSTAPTEAEKRYTGQFEQALTAGAVRNARMEAFEAGAEWALAQVRSGLKAELGQYDACIYIEDALAVVDRLEGKQ